MTDKLQTLAEIEGYEDWVQLIEAVGFDSVIPGICTNPGCEYCNRVEPDCDRGFCEECQTPTVKSAIELALF